MSATDELRKLLDEHGVEWSSIGGDTAWFDSRGWTVETVADDVDGTMLHVMTLMTPAEAVEATLGRGTCQIEERHGEWRCTGCGEIVGDSDPWSELYINGNAIKLWNYCPNCGREVVE